MGFVFYSTYYPSACFGNPVVLGYERASEELARELVAYPGRQFLHSGNFWNLDPEKRVPENVLPAQELLSNERTDGLMSVNVLPESEVFSERLRALEKSLVYADRMLSEKKVKAPLFCCLEVVVPEDAVFFEKALDSGHRFFSLGFGFFLKKHRGLAATKRMLEIVARSRQCLDDFPLHCSGVCSLRVLPFLALLGASSSDGSTPVQAALAFGTVYDEEGRGHRVSRISEWSCGCRACRGGLVALRKPANRVLHNLLLWEKKVLEINEALRENSLRDFVEKKARGSSRYFSKLFEWFSGKEAELKKF